MLNLYVIGYWLQFARTTSELLSGSGSLGINRNYCHYLWLSIVTLSCLAGQTPGLSQDKAKQAPQKWRPRDGVYMTPGKDFEQQCGEFGNLRILLEKKKIGGIESTCKVKTLTDTGPGAIRLDLICEDYDTVEDVDSSPDPAKRTQKEIMTQRKEIMTLRKVDENTLLSKATQNGKFKGHEERSAYCPEKWQRSFFESVAQDDAKQKATKNEK